MTSDSVRSRSRAASAQSQKSMTSVPGSVAGSESSAVGMKRTLGLGGGISYIIGVMIGRCSNWLPLLSKVMPDQFLTCFTI